MTETEDRLIAAAAIIGDGSSSNTGYRTPTAIGTQQRDAGAFHCHIRACARRDTDIRGGQRRGVIDAVTGHGDLAALAAPVATLMAPNTCPYAAPAASAIGALGIGCDGKRHWRR